MPSKCKFILPDTNEKCGKDASYGEAKREYCPKHGKELGLSCMKIDSRICVDCKKVRGSFRDENKKYRCKACAEKAQISVKSISKKCVDCQEKQPSFGIEKATHCAKCRNKSDEKHLMRDFVSILCKGNGCTKNATYGLEVGKPTHCKKCSSSEMFDVKNKRCEENGCTKQATFGLQNSKATRCLQHKSDDMIDLKHDTEHCKECKDNGIIRRATYGFKNSHSDSDSSSSSENRSKPISCEEHRSDKMVDVVSVMCKKCGEVQPIFGFKTENKKVKSELYCKHCSEQGMKNLVHKLCPCEKQPVYNFIGEKRPICCKECKEDEMVDIVNKKCEKCHLYFVTAPNTLCSICSDSPFQKRYENEVLEYLVHEFGRENFSHNKSVKGCLFRPDFLFTYQTHSLIIEVDEDQHARYDKNEEEYRMHLIQTGLKKDCIFIRYNPNVYRNEKGQIKTVKDPLVHLGKLIRECETPPTDKPIQIVKLFYNGEMIQREKMRYDSVQLQRILGLCD